jgi:hypothetical protein
MGLEPREDEVGEKGRENRERWREEWLGPWRLALLKDSMKLTQLDTS